MTTIKSLFLLSTLLFSIANLFSHKDVPNNDEFDDNRRFPFTDQAIKEKKETTNSAEKNKKIEKVDETEKTELPDETKRQLQMNLILQRRSKL